VPGLARVPGLLSGCAPFALKDCPNRVLTGPGMYYQGEQDCGLGLFGGMSMTSCGRSREVANRSLGARARRRTAIALCLAGAFGFLAQPAAYGQSREELDKARAQFQEGLALSAASNWSAALAKFRAVARVRMTPQVAFNIAECEEKLGKLLSALGNYRLAASSAAESGKAKDVEAQVPGRIQSLEERIPKLTIERGQGSEVAKIELDGTELGSAQLNTPVTIDPGTHQIVAYIRDKEVWRQTIEIAEKEGHTVTVKIDAPPPAEDTGTKPDDQTKPDDTKPVDEPPRSKVPGAVVLGIGVAGIGAGVAFIAMRQGTIADLDEQCGNDLSCPPSAEATADKGKLFTGLSFGAFGVGAVGVGVGIALLVRASSGGASAAPAEPAVSLPGTQGKVRFIGAAPGANLGGFTLTGSF
jgi:hypothetical protein